MYLVNEIYRTIHGEGVRYGIPHVFVRFSLCDLTCNFCDTEFESGISMTADQLVAAVTEAAKLPAATQRVRVEGAKIHETALEIDPALRNVLFCGGEPLLQLNDELIAAFKKADPKWFICVETNGAHPCPDGVDWITCSPKVAEHAIRLKRANEVKYVRAHGMGIPRPRLQADHYLLSPMFNADRVDAKNLAWCAQLVQDNPPWRLTVQHHKLNFGGMR